MMNYKVKYLEWDSQFFDLRIGNVNLEAYNLQRIEEIKDLQGFDLIYLQSSSKVDNLVCVDERIMYVHPIGSLDSLEDERMKKAEVKDYEFLYPLALQASHESRFRKDEKIPSEKVDELYAIWLEKSLSKKLANDVFCLSERDRIIGFVTCKYEGVKARIGLIAVDQGRRGQGLGRFLMNKVLNECAKKGVKKLELSTQASNVGACRFYEGLGFKIKQRTYIYHLWLKN